MWVEQGEQGSPRVLEGDPTGPDDGPHVGHEGEGYVQGAPGLRSEPPGDAISSGGGDRNKLGGREVRWVRLEANFQLKLEIKAKGCRSCWTGWMSHWQGGGDKGTHIQEKD